MGRIARTPPPVRIKFYGEDTSGGVICTTRARKFTPPQPEWIVGVSEHAKETGKGES